METSVRKLMREKEELCQALEEQEEQASITLQEETHRLRVQNQELQHKVPDTTGKHRHCSHKHIRAMRLTDCLVFLSCPSCRSRVWRSTN